MANRKWFFKLEMIFFVLSLIGFNMGVSGLKLKVLAKITLWLAGD